MNSNEDTKKSDSEDDELIDWPHVGTGIFVSLHKAKRLFDDAKFLFDNKKYERAIPIFINSIEESLKSYEFSIKFRKYQTVSTLEWNKLQDHKHKLTHVKEFVIKTLEDGDKKELEKMQRDIIPDSSKIKIDQMINQLKSEIAVDSQLQGLKEKCLYTDWDKQNKEWNDFDLLDESKQEDLAFYVMKKAELELERLHFGIENAVNSLRHDDKDIKNLEYPKYNEFREIKNYDSLKLSKPFTRGEKTKYDRGKRIMQKFISKNAVWTIYEEITYDNLRLYLKLTNKHAQEDWFPHPIIRALLLAFNAANSNDKDGNFMGVSGDAEEAYDEKPMMSTVAIVAKKDDKFSVEKIVIMTDENDEYNISDKIIEKIIDTEMVIERFKGKEMPLEAVHEAFSKIGIKLRKLKDEEIEKAIEFSKDMIKQNKIKGMPEEIIPKILSATKDNWEDLDPLVRSVISSGYGSTLPIEENQIVMSGYVDPMRKFKVRGLIYQILKRNEFLMNY